MELNKLKEVPKNYIKEILRSIFKLEKIKKIKFSGVHFDAAKRELEGKIENYKKIESQASKVWKIIELSRNEERPQTSDYIRGIFEDFIELSGDRKGAEDKSVISGLGRIGEQTVAVIGHNKGKDIKQKVEFNFGMSIPQGYRKANRIMKLADRFGFPVVTFIDTPGAYPGIEAEDAGQAGAISESILTMFSLKVPVIVILIGEGGSGGALALAIGNYIMMLENSTYSVITPEGCAAILWKDASAAKLAALALKMTSRDLLKLGLVDKIIYEPHGGAQNDPNRMVKIVRSYLINALKKCSAGKDRDFKQERAKKYESMGLFTCLQKEYPQKE
ncbi:MAG: acetyl-CoA carboxylase carboxyltransferase subunit alpha, partial [Actinobacteria bacterium]|nr:acetyl-CoA carboxylase carboxyltransferase subunit alpha [Actinomycetota bacterium]